MMSAQLHKYSVFWSTLRALCGYASFATYAFFGLACLMPRPQEQAPKPPKHTVSFIFVHPLLSVKNGRKLCSQQNGLLFSFADANSTTCLIVARNVLASTPNVKVRFHHPTTTHFCSSVVLNPMNIPRHFELPKERTSSIIVPWRPSTVHHFA